MEMGDPDGEVRAELVERELQRRYGMKAQTVSVDWPAILTYCPRLARETSRQISLHFNQQVGARLAEAVDTRGGDHF